MNKILVVLLFLSLIIFPSASYAQEKIANPTPIPIIKYNLPSPGILPDNPLYKLKVLKDKIILTLISDPMKKADYYLLLADKQIQASKLLVDKNEIALAKETALKGENQYTLLVFLFKEVGKKPDKALFDRLETAALKHQEILNEIISKVDTKNKKTFEQILEFSKRNADELRTIYSTD